MLSGVAIGTADHSCKYEVHIAVIALSSTNGEKLHFVKCNTLVLVHCGSGLNGGKTHCAAVVTGEDQEKKNWVNIVSVAFPFEPNAATTAGTPDGMVEQGWTRCSTSMSGHSAGSSAPKKKRVTGSARAGLVFPVGRVAKRLRTWKVSKRLTGDAACYLTAVLEYCVAELLEAAVGVTKLNRAKRLTPRHITIGVRADEELSKLLGPVSFLGAGSAGR